MHSSAPLTFWRWERSDATALPPAMTIFSENTILTSSGLSNIPAKMIATRYDPYVAISGPRTGRPHQPRKA
jgi:hypothetical protein